MGLRIWICSYLLAHVIVYCDFMYHFKTNDNTYTHTYIHICTHKHAHAYACIQSYRHTHSPMGWPRRRAVSSAHVVCVWWHQKKTCQRGDVEGLPPQAVELFGKRAADFVAAGRDQVNRVCGVEPLLKAHRAHALNELLFRNCARKELVHGLHIGLAPHAEHAGLGEEVLLKGAVGDDCNHWHAILAHAHACPRSTGRGTAAQRENRRGRWQG